MTEREQTAGNNVNEQRTPGSAKPSGGRGRRFKSYHSDHYLAKIPEFNPLAIPLVTGPIARVIPLHQSQLAPAENKFHVGNGSDSKHYWLTPPDLYAELDLEFHFDFDPCPYPLPPGFDGLTCEWGVSSYVNPPFGSILRFPHQNCEHETATRKSRTCVKCGAVGKKLGPTAWVRKAIEESRKGKTVVLVYPVDKWVLMLLDVLGASVRNLRDVRWLATEDGSQGKGTGRHIACFILGPPRHQARTQFPLPPDRGV